MGVEEEEEEEGGIPYRKKILMSLNHNSYYRIKPIDIYMA